MMNFKTPDVPDLQCAAKKIITWILHELEAPICKAFQGAVIVLLLQALNNAADGSLRLARRVKIDEKKKIFILLYHLGIISITLNFC